MTTLRNLLAEATARLHRASVDSPRLSAEILLADALGTDRLFLASHPDDTPPSDAAEHFLALVSRRETGEPVAYLTGVREFFGRPFHIDRHTLIPRPETELMIEEVLNDTALDPERTIRFLDLGTGSGCIAATIAAERPRWSGVAIDISKGALAMARRNATALDVDIRLEFLREDMRNPRLTDSSFDLILANPPYISGRDFDILSPEVRDFEPTDALVPDGRTDRLENGMDLETAAATTALRLLRPGGTYLAEHGCDQEAAMKLLFKNDNWIFINDFKDLSGKSRFIKALRR